MRLINALSGECFQDINLRSQKINLALIKKSYICIEK